MSEKVIGYSLLTLGLLIVVYSVINGANVFSGKTRPFPIFNFEPITIDYGTLMTTPVPPGTNLKQEIASSALLSQPLNLIAHLMFIGFLASVGAKIAGTGTNLIRPIIVKGKNEP